MERNLIPRLRGWFLNAGNLLVATCMAAGLVIAQPSLRITSPAAGTTVHPGEYLSVIVKAEGTFQLVSIAAPHPLGLPFSNKALAEPPYRFTVQIPKDISPMTYALTAMGFTSPGHLVHSEPVNILIERADFPTSISVYPPVADFTMDQKRYLQVTGLYADKTTADLTNSNQIKFVSSAPGVATVQPPGIVVPVAPGAGKIIITYGDLKLEVPVRVRQSRR
jgi:hypothetical protein